MYATGCGAVGARVSGGHEVASSILVSPTCNISGRDSPRDVAQGKSGWFGASRPWVRSPPSRRLQRSGQPTACLRHQLGRGGPATEAVTAGRDRPFAGSSTGRTPDSGSGGWRFDPSPASCDIAAKSFRAVVTSSGCGAVGSALRSGRRGRRIEAGQPDHAAVAHSGERRPVKAEATGSKPVGGAHGGLWDAQLASCHASTICLLGSRDERLTTDQECAGSSPAGGAVSPPVDGTWPPKPGLGRSNRPGDATP
jgi:hypothetical protein